MENFIQNVRTRKKIKFFSFLIMFIQKKTSRSKEKLFFEGKINIIFRSWWLFSHFLWSSAQNVLFGKFPWRIKISSLSPLHVVVRWGKKIFIHELVYVKKYKNDREHGENFIFPLFNCVEDFSVHKNFSSLFLFYSSYFALYFIHLNIFLINIDFSIRVTRSP